MKKPDKSMKKRKLRDTHHPDVKNTDAGKTAAIPDKKDNIFSGLES